MWVRNPSIAATALGQNLRALSSFTLVASFISVLALNGLLIQTIGASATEKTDYPLNQLKLQSGQVTAVPSDEIQINGHRYSLVLTVVVSDDEGRSKTLKDILPGMLVKFHVRQDQIDQIVIMLPR